ncbi:MAG: hypothetical protein ABEL76_17730, partial [Bradymonadaceae bacterium]
MRRQAYEQTDAMLAQIVRTEADGVIREIEEHGIHVHDTKVTLPTVQGPVAEKHALAYDANCRVLAS